MSIAEDIGPDLKRVADHALYGMPSAIDLRPDILDDYASHPRRRMTAFGGGSPGFTAARPARHRLSSKHAHLQAIQGDRNARLESDRTRVRRDILEISEYAAGFGQQ